MNKRLKTLLWILAACVVIAIVVFGVLGASLATTPSETASSTSETASTSAAALKAKTAVHTAKTSSVTTSTGSAVVPPVIVWSFQDRGKDAKSQQYTDVTLKADDNQYELGTIAGVCKTLADADLKGSGEISAVQCLTQGKGDEIGVFKQGNVYVVKKGTIELGEQGNPDVRGTFTVVQTLP